jgi:transcriptional regulator with XRE-family HTH domain
MNCLASGLKAIRKDLDNTQLEMASELGVSISTYKRYENGDLSIPGSVLKILSDMNYNINWLLTGKGNMLDNKLLSDISRLSSEDQQVITELVERLNNKK